MNRRPEPGGPAVPLASFIRIDAACDQFEEECRAGRQPDLATYLDGVSQECREPLFRNLLILDFEYRQRRGELPSPGQYREQFSDLGEVVDSVFRTLGDRPAESALRSPDTEWAGPDDADGEGETRLVRRVGYPGARTGLGPEALADFESAGYEVRRLLGSGGMGIVFEAHQISLNRTVALKVIRSDSFASEPERLRFQNEAEAVAQLDHPQIVPIYEVGSRRGRHFFSMKLISGGGLDLRLEEFAQDPKRAAQLVATIAEAIHHAHQRGILHRDLKPANILLDEQGTPHITDFGLAKRLDGDFELTRTDILVGTPSYMAPEQTTRGRAAVSTATDVYGLGSILYALLAGRAPFKGSSLVETLDLVRTSTPEPPSRLNPRVPRDLEVICRKCLEKDPARRYPSALALSEDLSRWLRGEPILARPVGPRVRAMMWARRNPALAATAMLAGLFLVAGFAGVTWKWREAVRERARSDAVVDLMIQRVFVRADPEINAPGQNPTARELLDHTASTLGGWLDGQADVEAQVRTAIGGAYLSLDQFRQAEDQLRSAVRLDAQAEGPDGRTGLRATNLLATLLDRTGRSGEAETLLRGNLDRCRQALGGDEPITLDAGERLGTVLWHLGRLDEAEATLRRNVEDRTRVFKAEHPQTLRSIYLLSRLLRERKQFREAKDLAYRYAHDIQCARGTNHPDRIVALTNQGDVERDQGQPAAAEHYYRQAVAEAGRILGPDHPATHAAEAKLKPSAGASPSTPPSRPRG